MQHEDMQIIQQFLINNRYRKYVIHMSDINPTISFQVSWSIVPDGRMDFEQSSSERMCVVNRQTGKLCYHA